MSNILKALYFRSKGDMEKAIVKDAKKNFRDNCSEAIRNRLAERYCIEIAPRLSNGTQRMKDTNNIRVTRVEKSIYDAVRSDADMMYEGNTSQTIRIGLINVYRKLGMIK